jgi:flagellar protein FlaF
MYRANIYEQVQRESLEGRELEASVLFKASQKLHACAREWDQRETREFQDKLTEALQFNQKLWSFLEVELANPAHPMPETLRLNLLRLGKFVDKRIFILFAGRGTLDDLLSIARVNEQIGKGLEKTPSDSENDQIEGSTQSLRVLDIAG